MEAASGELAIAAGGDMPDLSTAVLLEMLRVIGEPSVDAVVLQDKDRFRPLPCLVRVAPARDAAHALLHAGERSLRSLLRRSGSPSSTSRRGPPSIPPAERCSTSTNPATLHRRRARPESRVVAVPQDAFGWETSNCSRCVGRAPLALSTDRCVSQV